MPMYYNSSRISITAVLGLGLALAVAGETYADSISIVNAGFEDPFLADGSFTGAAPPGWTLTGRGGSFNPTVGNFLGEAPEGRNTAWLHSGTLSQTLTEVLRPGKYLLQVEIGDSVFTRFPGYAVEFLAGADVLAKDVNTLVPPNGMFLTSTLEFTASAGHSGLGKSLAIRLSSLGEETNFDDVRLDFTLEAVPEPSSLLSAALGLVGLAGLTGWKSKRLRRSWRPYRMVSR